MALSQTVPSSRDPDTILVAFLDMVAQRGVSLYPAQEEAILELIAGKNVILNTPTGSGKSLVAVALHFKGLAEGKRSFYTCPIKALVSEKFFALCDDFGAGNVGMLTGDASINRDAPIICCTAEILANIALGEGSKAAVDYVVMDEFHYYSDRDRGAAWQIPLLLMPQTRFLLMSATLGDCQQIEESLWQTTGVEVATVKNAQRPVPLDYEYRETPIHETLAELIRYNKFPIYVVNFTQRETVEQAQNVLSTDFCSKEEKQAIAESLRGFRFDTPFGKDMRRFVAHGVGLHHAGLLPKYRLLVEKLAQEGLLKIIMGTDTLGVGVNIPIRSVLFTRLCKYDGEKTAILSVRDFKQVGGRAGRKGFDDQGSVVAQAPEHVIENKRAESRVENNPAKKRKLVKKKPPTKNYVPFDETTFRRLIADPPEPLVSRFAVTHALLLTLLQSQDGQSHGYKRLVELIARCHDTPGQKQRHRRQARAVFQALRQAGIVNVVRNRLLGNRLALNENLQDDFSLNHTLSLFLIDTLPRLDVESPTYPLDVLTLVESILENPHLILAKQVDKLKDAKMAEMKAGGIEYDERIAELEKIEHPKPNSEFIYATFNHYAEHHPWVGRENIYPKSVVRDMFERCASFAEYVREFGLQRSEGLVLRYISQAYKTLVQTVPEQFKDERVEEIEVFFRTLLGHVDSSLLQEWEQLLAPPDPTALAPVAPKVRLVFDPAINARAFAARIRTEMHRLLKALAGKDYDEAAAGVREIASDPWPPERFGTRMTAYLAEHPKLLVDPAARQSHNTQVRPLGPRTYEVRQIMCDPEGHNDWYIAGIVELEELDATDSPVVRIEAITT